MERVRIEYPKCMYKGGKTIEECATLEVKNVQEHKAAWDKGWRGPPGHPRLNKKNQALLDYEASLEVDTVEVSPKSTKILLDSKEQFLDSAAVDVTTKIDKAVSPSMEIDGDLKVKGKIEAEKVETLEVSAPEGSTKPVDPEVVKPDENGKPVTEEELQDAFKAENPKKKAIHGEYETKAYTAWKKQHGYE